jgi:hypothetical protein
MDMHRIAFKIIRCVQENLKGCLNQIRKASESLIRESVGTDKCGKQNGHWQSEVLEEKNYSISLTKNIPKGKLLTSQNVLPVVNVHKFCSAGLSRDVLGRIHFQQ